MRKPVRPMKADGLLALLEAKYESCPRRLAFREG
jgi:hypothetical protein